MAEIEKTEFEFPDEIEEKKSRLGSKVVEAEEPPEIEIIDDTPEKDKNRGAPMETPPEEVTDEELAKYSDKKLQDRLAKLGRGYHDERRAKEAALREKDEAFRIAQSIIEENKKLKGSLSTSQDALLEQAKRSISTEIEDAKREYKSAYESGDADALLAAQDKLTTAKIHADKVNNYRPAPLQEEKNVVQPVRTTQADPKAEHWRTNNLWFGKDREMTGYALALHEKLVLEDGLDPSSDEYYKRLNGRIRHVFSEKFPTDEADANTSQRQKGNVVAPATRSTAPRKIVLNATQVNIAKRLGVPLELYARKVAEEMRK